MSHPDGPAARQNPVMSTTHQPPARRTSLMVKKRHLAALSSVVAIVVLLVGSYRGGWTWTGFRSNGTLWDWLHLFLLPVAVVTVPLWFGAFQERRRWWARRWLWSGVALTVAFVVVVVGGYGFSWAWTGFKGNTLWDWLGLLLVPAILPVATFWLTHRAEESRAAEATQGSAS